MAGGKRCGECAGCVEFIADENRDYCHDADGAPRCPRCSQKYLAPGEINQDYKARGACKTHFCSNRASGSSVKASRQEDDNSSDAPIAKRRAPTATPTATTALARTPNLAADDAAEPLPPRRETPPPGILPFPARPPLERTPSTIAVIDTTTRGDATVLQGNPAPRAYDPYAPGVYPPQGAHYHYGGLPMGGHCPSAFAPPPPQHASATIDELRARMSAVDAQFERQAAIIEGVAAHQWVDFPLITIYFSNK
jgi:hypothetical protein